MVKINCNCIAYWRQFQDVGSSAKWSSLQAALFSIPVSCLHHIWRFFLEIPFELGSSLFFFLFSLLFCFLNLRYNWHVTLRKFKIYTLDRILMYCNMIITVALANPFVMSHHYHFGGGSTLFWRYSTLEKFFSLRVILFYFFFKVVFIVKWWNNKLRGHLPVIPMF